MMRATVLVIAGLMTCCCGCTSTITKVTDYFDDGVTVIYLADEDEALLLSAEKQTYNLKKEEERKALRKRLASLVPE